MHHLLIDLVDGDFYCVGSPVDCVIAPDGIHPI